MARPADPFIGRDVLNGQFQILQKIGSGGMGSVYKALQVEMNRMVAVKILHPKLAGRVDLVTRFRREARAMSHLRHPNTVQVYLYGELDDGSLYIIMEFLDGKNLNQTVRGEGPLPLERGLPLLIQASGALDEAHQKGIIHRDMKPENIFVTKVPASSGVLGAAYVSDGQAEVAKVLDFGLAKVTEREMRPGSLILTQEGMVFGTPEFMSPEQAQGKSLDATSDIYSLAVILYEVLTGKLPFDAKNAMEFIQLHVQAKPIPIGERAPDKTFPPLLWQVMSKALAKNTEERFQTASEFGWGLQAVLDGYDVIPPQGSGSLRPPKPHHASSSGKGPASLGSGSGSASGDAVERGHGHGHEIDEPTVPMNMTQHIRDSVRERDGSEARRSGQSRASRQNMPLLMMVAGGFLLLGIAIAFAVMKLGGH